MSQMVRGGSCATRRSFFYLKADQFEFLEERRLKDLVKTLSEFIGFPNEVFVEKSNEKKMTDSEDRESAAGYLSPQKDTEIVTGGSSVARRSFVPC